MSKYWLLLVLITNGLLTERGFAQEPKPVQLPDDLYATIAAMPIAAPVKDGNLIKVIDGVSRLPVANADVLVITNVRDKAFQKRAQELQTAMIAKEIEQKQSRLLMAAMMGTRYQTDADGNASIPAGDDTFAIVISGKMEAQWNARMKGPLELFAPRFVTVQVRTADGKPARGVELGLGMQGRHFHAQIKGKTDASGSCTLEVSDRLGGNDLIVAALIASDDRIEVAFQADAIPDTPLQLQLPPCGQVRFIFYGEDERPSEVMKRALLNWELTPTAIANTRVVRRMTTMWPSQLDPDGAMFTYVALGLDIEISAYIEGISEALKFEAKGPTREHELIIVEGRSHTGPPIVSIRVTDQQGQPVANEELGVVLYSADRHTHSNYKTDADGQLVILLQELRPESIYVVRRSQSEGTDYRGAARIPVGELQPGKQQLADVQLQDEPVIASGHVVDAEGKPVADLWLRGKTTIISGNGGGRNLTGWWWFEHRVRTDEQGHFEIREISPVDKAMKLRIESDAWALLGDALTLKAGSTKEIIRVGTASQLEGEFLGDLQDTRLDFTVTNRDTGKQTSGRMRHGKYVVSGIPAGNYDIAFGRNADFKIENVKSAIKGDTQDPRLRTAEWQKHFQLLETTVTDENNKPLEGLTVWYHVKHKNGRGSSGSGANTNKDGKARSLSPLKNASIEVREAGYEPQRFEKNLQNLKVQLLPVAAIEVQIVGMPKLPDGVYAQATVTQEAQLIRMHASSVRLVKGRATVQPQAIGKCSLQILLGADYQREQTNQVRQALRRALNLKALTFELVGTRKPTEPKVFTLDQDTIDDINACLDDAREVLKQKDK